MVLLCCTSQSLYCLKTVSQDCKPRLQAATASRDCRPRLLSLPIQDYHLNVKISKYILPPATLYATATRVQTTPPRYLIPRMSHATLGKTGSLKPACACPHVFLATVDKEASIPVSAAVDPTLPPTLLTLAYLQSRRGPTGPRHSSPAICPVHSLLAKLKVEPPSYCQE
nr:hypothetical protein L204_00009 [Cryptococcus depauperatus CBS 7855]